MRYPSKHEIADSIIVMMTERKKGMTATQIADEMYPDLSYSEKVNAKNRINAALKYMTKNDMIYRTDEKFGNSHIWELVTA